MPAMKDIDLMSRITGDTMATLRSYLIANDINGVHNARKHDIQTKGTNEYFGLIKKMGTDRKKETTKKY